MLKSKMYFPCIWKVQSVCFVALTAFAIALMPSRAVARNNGFIVGAIIGVAAAAIIANGIANAQRHRAMRVAKHRTRAPALSASELPASFTGVWIEASAQNNLCKASEWETRGTDQNDNEYNTRLAKVTDRSLEGWETGCNITFVKTAKSYVPDREAVGVDLACSGKGMSWRSKQLWQVETLDNRKSLVVTTLKNTDLRDGSGKLVRKGISELVVSNYLACH